MGREKGRRGGGWEKGRGEGEREDYGITVILIIIVPYFTVKLQCQAESNQVKELKKTWELANDHFIVSQDKLQQEIYRLYQKLEAGGSVR